MPSSAAVVAAASPFAAYLNSLRDLRATGAAVKETSYYPPLSALLEAIGGSLKPAVRPVGQLKNFLGAGSPDFGFYGADQFPRRADLADPTAGQLPARGVLEAKGPGDDVLAVAASPQVAKYLAAYGLVLVTNLRDFLLVSRGPGNVPVFGERYSLSPSETAFWHDLGQSPARLAARHAVGLAEFLRRALLHEAPLADPRDVAFFLASYARHALGLLDEQADLPALAAVRTALEEALGIRFDGERGEHFFRSTLVQTLFYGVFSAWVLWSRENPPGSGARFDWRLSAWSLRVPILRTLFVQLTDPGRLQPLGLDALLDWTAGALRRVDRPRFFAAFDATGADAVQYFYEPFLAAFDPDLRKELGVWYTPREIVRYQVARVDDLLKTDLGLPDGLADPRVVVLDPCCGTGAYLVETLRRIEANLRARGDADALLASDLKTAVTTRLFGFELIPAPFVVAHLQMGLLLAAAGAPLGGDERAAVFLTNALTGWEPPDPARAPLLFPELAAERAAAEAVKQEARILVILGNPPYNGFAGLAVAEERDLADAYRGPAVPGLPAPQGQGLNDLYVRFFRMAERRIAGGPPGRGIVSFISNYSWLDGLSHPLMRARFAAAFDAVWVDCLNGDKYKTGKLTPDGRPDPSVFSTETNREGIQVGTAVVTLVRRSAADSPTGGEVGRVIPNPPPVSAPPTPPASSTPDGGGRGVARPTSAAIRFRHWWGKDKRAELEASAAPFDPAAYQTLAPPVALGMPFVPVSVGEAWLTWPRLPELLPFSFPGVQTKRDDFVIDNDRDVLLKRIQTYFDTKVSNEEIARSCPRAMEKTGRFDPNVTREYLQQRGFLPEYLVRYSYRPFDYRWIYWEPETRLLGEKSPTSFRHIFPGNLFIEARQKESISEFSRGAVSSVLPDNFGNGFSTFFPLLTRDAAILGGTPGEPRPNLSPAARTYLAGFGADVPPDSLFFHAVATLHAPTYRENNAGALRQDWPRVPLPADRDVLLASAALGRQVAALLDPETPVPGVAAGKGGDPLFFVARLRKDGDTPLDPAADLAVTAGWGSLGAGGAVMPGRGRLTPGWEPDSLWMLNEPDDHPLNQNDPPPRPDFYHVHLNGAVCWSAVPRPVWEYTLGGYPVLKKWLSYREQSVLGRPLRPEEAREFTAIARRIHALLALGEELDAAHYRAAAR